MKLNLDINLLAGDLIEVRSSFLHGSMEDQNFRRELAISLGPTTVNLIDKCDLTIKRRFCCICNFLERRLSNRFANLSPGCKLSVELLISSNSREIIIFSILGQGDMGVELLSQITKFMRSTGSKFILINYVNSGEFPDLAIFNPVAIKHANIEKNRNS